MLFVYIMERSSLLDTVHAKHVSYLQYVIRTKLVCVCFVGNSFFRASALSRGPTFGRVFVLRIFCDLTRVRFIVRLCFLSTMFFVVGKFFAEDCSDFLSDPMKGLTGPISYVILVNDSVNFSNSYKSITTSYLYLRR